MGHIQYINNQIKQPQSYSYISAATKQMFASPAPRDVRAMRGVCPSRIRMELQDEMSSCRRPIDTRDPEREQELRPPPNQEAGACTWPQFGDGCFSNNLQTEQAREERVWDRDGYLGYSCRASRLSVLQWDAR